MQVVWRELFSVLGYRGQNAKGFKRSSAQECLGHNQQVPISLAPPSELGICGGQLAHGLSGSVGAQCPSGTESSARRPRVPLSSPAEAALPPAAHTAYRAYINITCRAAKRFMGGIMESAKP